MADPFLDRYANFFLTSTSNIVQLETLEITHPSFSQVNGTPRAYKLVRNAIHGIATGDAGNFTYYPMKIGSLGARDNLDSGVKIDFGDLGEVLPKELDRIATEEGFDTKPQVIYRVYRSDDLSSPIYGPLSLEIVTISFNKDGCSFEAKAPSVNIVKTGEVYTVQRFPMLRGFMT